jgi:hypothetical protein
MAFFDDVPPPEPAQPRQHHPWEPPLAEFPGVVPIGMLLLGRSEQAAVAVTGISAFSAGFEIFLTARFRPGPNARPLERAAEPQHEVMAPWRLLRFGIQLPDGSKIIGEHGHRGPDDARPAGPILRAYLGGGGPRTHFSRWWSWPLPPAGPLEFVCEWATAGIAETRASLDGELIRDAAARSLQIWPGEGG